MCVFSVSQRRRSWILGQAVSLWAGVLCNHTHKHSEDSRQECRAVMQRSRSLPPTSTHTHTLFSPCLLPPRQALTPEKVRQEGKTFHPTATEHTLSSRTHTIFSRIVHMIGHKANLCKFRKSEVILSIYYAHTPLRG